jgi:predicted acetyltransferase
MTPVGIRLEAVRTYSAENSPWGVPAVRYAIVQDGQPVGTISLRPDATYVTTHLAGQIGFEILPDYRGKGLAQAAVRALFPVFREHGLEEVWITTTPANIASQRTLAALGSELIGEVPIPAWYDSFARGERTKLRYRLRVP